MIRRFSDPAMLRRASSLCIAAALAALPMHAVHAQAAPLTIKAVPTRAMPDGFTLAAVGDLIYLRPMLATLERQSPAMLRILRDADATFGNFETSVIDLKSFRGSPQAESGGTWMMAVPGVAGDLVRMGFDIVSHANNHATDWGAQGLADTNDSLDDAGLPSAGTGPNLASARAPRYYDGPTGRLGLVAATSSFTPMSRAADPLGEVPGRPGVNALRSERTRLVSQSEFASLARLADAAPGAPVALDGIRYKVSDTPRPAREFSYELNRVDEGANLLSIRQAKQNSNFALFSLHNHEPGNWSQKPADFAIELAHKAIDAGADAFVGHGPHQLRGIEIYKGRPIFYSLGNFAMMNNSLDAVPPDMYDQYGVVPGSSTTPELLQARAGQRFADPNLYESVIAVSRYVGGRVAEIRLYPLDLGVSTAGASRGVPRMADATVGRRILERLQKLSSPFGTRISIEANVGVIRVPAAVDAAEVGR